jgi:hypothetical protein
VFSLATKGVLAVGGDGSVPNGPSASQQIASVRYVTGRR